MPLLFISYKHGDNAVEPIVRELQLAKYRTWFDKKSLVTGSDWQKEISKGIQQSAAVIAVINKDCGSSIYIQEEIRLALEKNKPIFPVITDPLGKNELEKLGLSSIQYLDLTTIGFWKEGIEQLINDLKRSGIRISRHEITNPHTDNLYQLYFTRMRSRLGHTLLSKVAQGQEDTSIERVYTSISIDYSLSVDVKSHKIVDWWLCKPGIENNESRDTLKIKLEDVFGDNAEHSSLDFRIGQIQESIIQGVDSQYGDPKARPLIFAPPWYDGIKPGFWPLSAMDAAATCDRLILLGPPGSGKTTFARYLALCLSGKYIGSDHGSSDYPDFWPHGPLTPIYIELRQLVGWEGFPDANLAVTEEHFWHYVQQELLGNKLPSFAHNLQNDLIEGQAIIILDGLDEVPVPPKNNGLESRRLQLKELVRILQSTYPKSRILITSRPHGYQGWSLEGFSSISLSALNLQQMLRLATNLFLINNLDEHQAKENAESLVQALENVPNTLKDLPLFLTLMADLFLLRKGQGLPSHKVELYEESISLLLDRWTQSRLGEKSLLEQIGCNPVEIYRRLENVAYQTQNRLTQSSESGGNLGDIELGTILAELFKIGPEANPYKLLPYLSQQAGVLISPSHYVYQFAHKGFQEFLAAEYLVNQRNLLLIKDSIESNHRIWRESCLFVSDILAERGQIDQIWNLLDVLIENNTGDVSSNSPFWHSIWLAARIILDQGFYLELNRRRNELIVSSLRDQFKLLLSTLGALSIVERAEIGKCLGMVGDDRPGVGLQDGVPDIAWCNIPAGKFQMGTTPDQIDQIKTQEWAKGWGFSREVPATVYETPSFRISRYLITNMQFDVFVNDPNGYNNPQWWTNSGRKWVEKKGGPSDAFWDVPNYPRTSVTWYEAMAFCNWLSALLGFTVRLPTEAEWEKAAKGTDGRFFPWGNEFDSAKSNMNLSGINQPSSVGCILLPETPWGPDSPLDMSGNVWQWCSTICEEEGGDLIPYPYRDDERENIEYGEKHLRIMRGGSYLNPAFLVRTSYRGRGIPTSQFGFEGFRIVSENDSTKKE